MSVIALLLSAVLTQAEPTTPTAPPEPEPLAAAPAATKQLTGAENSPAESEWTPELEAAVSRGLEQLAQLQNADGSFGRGRYGRHVGITALCALAFMASGDVPGRGLYGRQVERALDYVLASTTESGLLATEATHGPMYGHGFATLFLGEVFGMNPDDTRVRDALARAVALIQNSQNDEGGWRYNPVPSEADISVTICQVMALRSARNSGIKVPKETIDGAVRYVRACQNDDGGFRYMSLPGTSAWPRTAAGVATLFYAGIYDDDAIARGLAYIDRNAPSGGPSGQAHYYYGHYYAVQAMYLAGGEHWKSWWPKVRADLLEIQDLTGVWTDHQAGSAYATAMALIVLQMPRRYLPIFQR